MQTKITFAWKLLACLDTSIKFHQNPSSSFKDKSVAGWTYKPILWILGKQHTKINMTMFLSSWLWYMSCLTCMDKGNTMACHCWSLCCHYPWPIQNQLSLGLCLELNTWNDDLEDTHIPHPQKSSPQIRTDLKYEIFGANILFLIAIC